MRAGCDQLRPQRDDPRIARGRAGLDHQQRVAGFAHISSASAPFVLADLADHIARHHEIGGISLGQRRAGFAAFGI